MSYTNMTGICCVPDGNLEPGVVAEGLTVTNGASVCDVEDCAHLPAMHADGSVSTALNVSGNLFRHGSEDSNLTPGDLTGDVEQDGGGIGCHQCDALDDNWSMALVHYQRRSSTVERYIYSSVPACKPYPAFRKCEVSNGTAWYGSEINPCSFRLPTQDELVNGASWLVDLDVTPLFSPTHDWNETGSFQAQGCWRILGVCEQDNEAGTQVGEAYTVTTNRFPHQAAVASVIIDVERPTGGSGAPVGGSVEVRFLCRTYALMTYPLEQGERPPNLFDPNGGPWASSAADGVCEDYINNDYSDDIGLPVELGRSYSRAWKATTGTPDPNDPLPASSWEWDEERSTWCLAKDWSKKIWEAVDADGGIGGPDRGLRDTAPVSLPYGASSLPSPPDQSALTAYEGDYWRCKIDGSTRTNDQWLLEDPRSTGLYTQQSPYDGGDIVVSNRPCIPWYITEGRDDAERGGHLTEENCIYRDMTVSLSQ